MRRLSDNETELYTENASNWSDIYVRLSKIKKKVLKLNVKETKPDTENVSNWNDFGFRVKGKWKFNERAMFRVSLQKLGLYLNP